MSPNRTFSDYLRPLADHGLLIAMFVVLAIVLSAVGLVGVTLGGFVPYEAQAVVLFKVGSGPRAVLTKDTTFQESTIDPARESRNVQVLMSSMEIADTVKQQATTSDAPEIKVLAGRDATDLLSAITVESRGDLFYINAKTDNPSAATWLANTWSSDAVVKANQFYATPSGQLQQTLDEAQAALTADQKALQDFLANNPQAELTQEQEQLKTFVNEEANSNTAVQLALNNAERDAGRARLAADYSSVYTLTQQVGEVGAFRTRIDQGGDSPDILYSNQVALLVLLGRVITGNPDAQLQLQFAVADVGKTPLSKATQLSDVDATLTAMHKMQDDLKGEIGTLEHTLNAPPPTVPAGAAGVPDTLRALVQRLNQVNSDLEQAKFRQTQLEKTRDLDQSRYDLVRTRLTEQNVNGAISRVVDVGVQANYADTVHSRSLARIAGGFLLQAILLAAALGIAIAYLLHALRPGFKSNATLRRLARLRPRNAS